MNKIISKIVSPFYKVSIKRNNKKIRILFFTKKVRLFPFVPEIKHVGKCTYSAADVYIPNKEETVIGSFTSIGKGVSIGCGTHPTGYLSSSPYLYTKRFNYKSSDMVSHEEWIDDIAPCKIGNDVWIGDNVLIMNGITIGDGAVIGAHAVVTKDVPPYAIVGGVPAKIIRYRFDEKIITALLKSQWWNLPDKIIKQIPYDDIEKTVLFLKDINKRKGN